MSACILMAACQSLKTENIPATMQTDLTAYAVTATEIRASGERRATQAAATISAAQTQVAYYSVYNQVLVATARADETAVPQQVLMVRDASGNFGVIAEMEFLQITLSDSIRTEDRCARNDMALFDAASTQRVYLTVVVTNMTPGTLLEVIWRRGGQQMHRTAWTAEQMMSNECVALELTRDQTAFVAGEWEAVLMADNRVIESVPFAMIEQTSTQ